MVEVNIQHAKTHLSRLLARVEAGEDVIIARNGKAVARLVSVNPPAGDRALGSDRGLVQLEPPSMQTFDDSILDEL